MNKILRATVNSKVYDVAQRTPLSAAPKLSKELETNVFLKREDLQPVFSFKIRGAYNKMTQLTEQESSRGVLCSSAGNHAQGVALSAQKLGLSALIVMPKTTPTIKVEAVENYGAQVVLYGDSYSEAAEHAHSIMKESGRTYIHPFDDPLVIAGQGTIGVEILEQLAEVSHIFVPVGGGGLIAGIANYMKAIKPSVKIIGVEPSDAACLQKALEQNKRIILPHVGIFADGVAVKQVGKETFSIAKKYVDAVITVSNDQICAAMKSIFEDSRSIVEPAGALGVAGITSYAQSNGFKTNDYVVAVNSGANMGFERLQYVTERTLIGAGREAIYSLELPEKAGALEEFCTELNGHTITEFNYRQNDHKKAHVLVGISTQTAKDAVAIERHLTNKGFVIQNLSNNELAKEHIRYMIGGCAGPDNEQLIQFDFPERRGALGDFLKTMSKQWNISLFHYRGTGSDNGRVLMGFDVPTKEASTFQDFLKNVGYNYTNETHDSSYSTFLRK